MMSVTLGALSRTFSQKCRILCHNIGRPVILSGCQERFPWKLDRCEFSDDVPNKPKRPLTSFFQFIKDQRPKIVASQPDITVTEVSKRLAAMWKELPEAEKDVYRSDFERRQSRYQEEMESFKSGLTDEQLDSLMAMGRKKKEMKAKRKQKMELRKLNKPRRPPTGYALYLKAHISSSLQPATGRTRQERQDLFREGAEAWKALPEYEKQQYNEEASLLSEAFHAEMEEWKRKMEAEGHKI